MDLLRVPLKLDLKKKKRGGGPHWKLARVKINSVLKVQINFQWKMIMDENLRIWITVTS